MSGEKQAAVKILSITTGQILNGSGFNECAVFGLGDDNRVYIWGDDSDGASDWYSCNELFRSPDMRSFGTFKAE